MWDKFTAQTRRVFYAAQNIATDLGDTSVSTEHLLLGLLESGEGVDALLAAVGTSARAVRRELERHLGRGDRRPREELAMTPRAKRVVDLAFAESRETNFRLVEPEHLLIALVREGDGLAGRTLAKLGIEPFYLRRVFLSRSQSGYPDQGKGPRFVLNDRVCFLENHCVRTHLLLAMIADPDDPGGEIIRKNCKDIGGLQWQLWNDIVRSARSTRVVQEPYMIDRLLARTMQEAKDHPVGSHHLLIALFAEGQTTYRELLETYGSNIGLAMEQAELIDQSTTPS